VFEKLRFKFDFQRAKRIHKKLINNKAANPTQGTNFLISRARIFFLKNQQFFKGIVSSGIISQEIKSVKFSSLTRFTLDLPFNFDFSLKLKTQYQKF